MLQLGTHQLVLGTDASRLWMSISTLWWVLMQHADTKSWVGKSMGKLEGLPRL